MSKTIKQYSYIIGLSNYIASKLDTNRSQSKETNYAQEVSSKTIIAMNINRSSREGPLTTLLLPFLFELMFNDGSWNIKGLNDLIKKSISEWILKNSLEFIGLLKTKIITYNINAITSFQLEVYS